MIKIFWEKVTLFILGSEEEERETEEALETCNSAWAVFFMAAGSVVGIGVGCLVVLALFDLNFTLAAKMMLIAASTLAVVAGAFWHMGARMYAKKLLLLSIAICVVMPIFLNSTLPPPLR